MRPQADKFILTLHTKMNLHYILLIFVLQNVQCAKILGIFPLAGKSMTILYNKLMAGLANEGHNVTVIGTFTNALPVTNGSYRDVLLTGFKKAYDEKLDDFMRINRMLETPTTSNPLNSAVIFHDNQFPITKDTIHHPNVQKLLQHNHTFDMVIMEQIWGGTVLFAFAAHYDCPLVLFASMGGVNPWVNEMVGNPMPACYVPHYWMMTDGMTLLDRCHNLLFYLAEAFWNWLVIFPQYNAVLPGITSKVADVADLYYTPSLVLLGTHVSLHQATPLVPNVVEIGGFHMDPPKALPDELQLFLDQATDGAIYFSMGTHIKGAHFSQAKLRMLIGLFKTLKQRVLWKYEDEVDVSDNVLVRSWLPQMDILAHHNLKLFITHGGYGSTQETIYHGVPTLMLPVFIDQFTNAKMAKELGFGLSISPADPNFTLDTMSTIVKELLENPSYTERAKDVSGLYRDRPMNPMDTALYWIEYVIRHKGAEHLKVAGVKLPWYQFYMVDVVVFVVLTLAMVVLVLIKVTKVVRKLPMSKLKVN